MHPMPTTDPALRQLFAPGQPNDTMLYATLCGQYPGHALADSSHSPSQAVVRTHYGTTFFSERVTDAFLAEAMMTLRSIGAVRIVVSREQFASRSLPTGRSRIIERIEFATRDPNRQDIQDLTVSLPAGLRIVPIDRHLFDRCLWREEILEACGDADRFFAYARGTCLLRQEEILSEAYEKKPGFLAQ